MARSWANVLNSLGTTTLSIILFLLAAPLLTFLVSLFAVWKNSPQETFMEHARKTIVPTVIGFVVPLAMVAFVFCWKVLRTTYDDHQALVGRVHTLVNTPKPAACPSCATCPTTFIEPDNSLRRRTIALVDELNEFWQSRPSPPGQIGPQNDEWVKYYRKATIAYENARFRQRLIGIVSQYKSAGVDTGTMEQSFSQPERLVGAIPYGGYGLENCFSYMSELCQLQDLAYRIDAHDQPIILTSKASIRK